ncbi:MAG: cytochrome C oxidase subunit IV [Gemmatimonadetes bacterium]|nr:cytochrome C oxidase subunit IV [Gemmatimonadota bacterium]
MHAHATEGHAAGDHSHPTPALYLKVAVVLFVLTALEVLAYEVGRRPTWPLHALVEPLVVPILLILSAAKFALVAMFYMHLKQDSKLFTNLFVWPIILAAAVIMGLIVLEILWLKASF